MIGSVAFIGAAGAPGKMLRYRISITNYTVPADFGTSVVEGMDL